LQLAPLISHLRAVTECEAVRAKGFVMVGIGGHGGSGKSTLAAAIASAMPDAGVQIVPTDSFWDGMQFDLPRLHHDVIEAISTQVTATYKEWDWANKRLLDEPRVVTPTGIVIIEGVCALHQMFRSHHDLKVWVTAPYDVRLDRGVARDGEAMRSTWTDVWMPSEDAYVARDNPVACADIIIDGTQPL
jgi:uridine kinase